MTAEIQLVMKFSFLYRIWMFPPEKSDEVHIQPSVRSDTAKDDSCSD